MNARYPIRRCEFAWLKSEHFQESRREFQMVRSDNPLVNPFSDRVEN